METLTGGRGARARILDAASQLFYSEGVNATGVERLAEVAHVSKRTLYQHFPSKDDVILAYLERFQGTGATPLAQWLARTDLAPRDKLIGLFDLEHGARGCPYLLVAAEISDPEHPARKFSCATKKALAKDLTKLAKEMGARDPKGLGAQLAVLFDGAYIQMAVLGSDEPLKHARAAAVTLIDASV